MNYSKLVSSIIVLCIICVLVIRFYIVGDKRVAYTETQGKRKGYLLDVVNNVSFDDCEYECDIDNKCAHFDYHTKSNGCYLRTIKKSNTWKTGDKSDVIKSGKRGGYLLDIIKVRTLVINVTFEFTLFNRIIFDNI